MKTHYSNCLEHTLQAVTPFWVRQATDLQRDALGTRDKEQDAHAYSQDLVQYSYDTPALWNSGQQDRIAPMAENSQWFKLKSAKTRNNTGDI